MAPVGPRKPIGTRSSASWPSMRPVRSAPICAAVGTLSKQSGGLFVVNNGMSEGTFYNWQAKFGGMTVSEAKRLKALEE